MSAYILEIRAVLVRHEGHVGHGVDDLGRGFEVSLDPTLAADVVTALEGGRRPIVAVEGGRSYLSPARDGIPGPARSNGLTVVTGIPR